MVGTCPDGRLIKPRFMQTQVNFASPEEPLNEPQKKMLVKHSRTLPVQNSESELLGLLTAEDVNEAYR